MYICQHLYRKFFILLTKPILRRYDALEKELADLKEPEQLTVPKPLPEGWRQMYDDLDAVGKQQFWRGIIKEIHITKWDRGPRKIEIIFL